MKAKGNIHFTIQVQGDTGYANQSSVTFDYRGVGQLRLDYTEWDLTSLVDITPNKIYISVPSGELEIYVSGYIAVEDVIQVDGQFYWTGKQAGLIGGMCGYGGWDVSEVNVTSGLFLQYRSLPLVDYIDMMNRSRLLFDLDEIQPIQWEGIMASYDTPPHHWQQWLNWLHSPEAQALEAEINDARETAHIQRDPHRRLSAEVEDIEDIEDDEVNS